MRTGTSGVSARAGGAGSSRVSWVAGAETSSGSGNDIRHNPRRKPHIVVIKAGNRGVVQDRYRKVCIFH